MSSPDLRMPPLRLLLAASVIVVALAIPSVWLRTAAALPLLLFLPGWAVLGAFGCLDRPLVERLVFGIGLSIALAAFYGFVLNWLGMLTPVGWGIGLAGTTIAASTLRTATSSSVPHPSRSTLLARASGAQFALFALAALVATLAIANARHGALAQRQYDYTEFWMVPSGSRDGTLVTLGVRNMESAETSYRVEFVADGEVIGRWLPFSLAPNEMVAQQIPINLPPGPERRVAAWLFKADAPDRVYRQVWIPTRPNPHRKT